MRINIYSEINDELLEELHEQLEKDCDKLEIHINSAGGSVISGLKVISMIHSKGVPTECYIEFLAASMAADIAMTCDKVYMNKFGLLMFHNAWSPNDEITDSQKEYLMKQSEMMCKMVAEKRGIDYATFVNYCNEEKWFIAEEALKEGLIDGIEDTMHNEYQDQIMELYSNKQFDLYIDVCKKLNDKKMDINKEAEIEPTTELVETELNKGMKPMKEDMEDGEDMEENTDFYMMECDKLRKENEMYKAELDKYKSKEAMAKKEALEIEVNKVLDEALKQGKITDKDEWSELLTNDFDKFSNVLKKIPVSNKKSFDIVTNVINKSVNYNEKENWTYKDWSKKDAKGLLLLLKENKQEYSRLFKEEFGVEYKG
jgi:hypothetical protein